MYPPFSIGPDRVVDCFEVTVAQVVKLRKRPPLERVFIPLLDGLPTRKNPVWGHQYPSSVKSAATATASLFVNASSCFVESTPNSSSALGSPIRSRCCAIRRSAVSFCWAKIGKTKLIASPAKAYSCFHCNALFSALIEDASLYDGLVFLWRSCCPIVGCEFGEICPGDHIRNMAVSITYQSALWIGPKKIGFLPSFSSMIETIVHVPTSSLGIVWVNAGVIKPVASATRARSTCVFIVLSLCLGIVYRLTTLLFIARGSCRSRCWGLVRGQHPDLPIIALTGHKSHPNCP